MEQQNSISTQATAGVFQRKEIKYRVSKTTIDSFLTQVQNYFESDERGTTLVSSLYFDTRENAIISRSLEKPTYKEKLRIRAYGQTTDDSEVFIELKKKFKGIVYKRRVSASLSDALLFMAGSDLELDDRNYLEIKSCRDRYIDRDLAPKMIIATNRISLFSNDGSDIRMTVDLDARYKTTDLDLRSTEDFEMLLGDDECILEIKAAKFMPRWLVDALKDNDMYPQSCSKYGLAHTKAMRARDRKDISEWKEVGCISATKSMSKGALYV